MTACARGFGSRSRIASGDEGEEFGAVGAGYRRLVGAGIDLDDASKHIGAAEQLLGRRQARQKLGEPARRIFVADSHTPGPWRTHPKPPDTASAAAATASSVDGVTVRATGPGRRTMRRLSPGSAAGEANATVLMANGENTTATYGRSRSRTAGLTTLIGAPSAKATIWSNTSANCSSHSSRVT